MQRSCVDVNSPYKRNCWANSVGPLYQSLSEEQIDNIVNGRDIYKKTSQITRSPNSEVNFFLQNEKIHEKNENVAVSLNSKEICQDPVIKHNVVFNPALDNE